jgi:hypothetical protein
MRPMRRTILICGLVALVAATSSPGASKARFKATLTAATHSPKVMVTWRYHVRATDPTGHPIWATITSQIVDPLGTAHLVEFDGTGHNPYVKNYRFFGNFCDSVLWPASSAVGVTLKLRTVITTDRGRTVLTYDVTPRS